MILLNSDSCAFSTNTKTVRSQSPVGRTLWATVLSRKCKFAAANKWYVLTSPKVKAVSKILLLLLLIVPFSWNCTGARFGERPGTVRKAPAKKNTDLSVKKYFDNVGEASYYADKFDGRITTSGEVFSQDSLTGAHLTLPFGTRVRVTNLKNNKRVIITINDRPPEDFKRLIDLSYRAAKELDMLKDGVTAVRIETVK